jgi:hypothetical protein
MKAQVGSMFRLSKQEERVLAYNERLEEFIHKLPKCMRYLIEYINTLYAEILNEKTVNGGLFQLTIRCQPDRSVFVLTYYLIALPEVLYAENPQTIRPFWRYNELEQVNNYFQHNIHLTNGKVKKILFYDFTLIKQE